MAPDDLRDTGAVLPAGELQSEYVSNSASTLSEGKGRRMWSLNFVNLLCHKGRE